MEITLDYAKAERQAGTLEQCANDMMMQSTEVSNIIAEVRSAWQGDTANTYIRKLEVLENELKINADKCSRDAADFRARVNSIKRADEAASNVSVIT